MRIDILTLFPDMIKSVMSESVIGRALENNIFELNVINIRDYSTDKHNRVDDAPYGGGSGMVMQVGPLYDAFNAIPKNDPRVLYLTPQGKTFNQQMAKELAKEKQLIFICGHYEGIDQRVIDEIAPEEISLGDFVLTGGELAVLPICDSILRLVPGVLGNENSAEDESFENGLLEYPQYTRPEEILGRRVPEVLLSGHHANIKKWRHEKALELTYKKRRDLIDEKNLSAEDSKLLKIIKERIETK